MLASVIHESSLRTLALAVIALASLAGGCNAGPAPTREWTAEDHTHAAGSTPPSALGQAAPPPVDDGLAPEDRAAQSLYLVSCASCHGAGGRGDGPSRAPMMRIPDFTTGTWQASRTDEEVAAIITIGRGMMPGFGDRLPENGIEALVRRLRRFAPPAPEPVEISEGDAGVADGGITEDVATTNDAGAPSERESGGQDGAEDPDAGL